MGCYQLWGIVTLDDLAQVDAPALQCLDDLHDVEVLHHVVIIAVLTALVVECRPKLNGDSRLYKPHDGSWVVVEFEHHRIGLQIGLSWHDTGFEAFFFHPGNDDTPCLNRYIAVVA